MSGPTPKVKLESLGEDGARAIVTGLDDGFVTQFSGRRERVIEAVRSYWPGIRIEGVDVTAEDAELAEVGGA